jgi:DNA-binding NarL/FixJ family response regulator/quercetin dioxygenase-like cupin family protein
MPPSNCKAIERTAVVVADDFPEMFEAVEKCLGPDCEIMEKVSDGVALVECIRRLQPDLLVTDISMPKMSGIEALRQLRSLGLNTPAIVLTICDDEELAKEAFSAGAQAFVLKSRMGSELQLAMEEVLAGRRYASETGRQKCSHQEAQTDRRTVTAIDAPHPEILLNRSGLFMFRTESMIWQAGKVPGCWVKTLIVEEGSRIATSLVRMDAGSHFPAHRHFSTEEVFLLAGDLVVEGQEMKPGDYCYAETNSVHSESHTETGCIFVLRTSELDEIIQ